MLKLCQVSSRLLVYCFFPRVGSSLSESFNLSAGYNYFGTERMYSGTDGREFEADIFFGVVYYQRLRHMVADKYQVACLEFQCCRALMFHTSG